MALLTVSKLILDLRFQTSTRLPYWMGSMFRGGFGQAVQRFLCSRTSAECDGCSQGEDCLFYHMYMRKKATRGYAPPSRPVILIPPFYGKPLSFEGGALKIEVLIFGRFVRFLPHILLGMQLLGQEGLGSLRHYGLNTFRIESAECAFSEKSILQGNVIKPSNIKAMDIKEIGPYPGNYVRVGFKTPFTGPIFPKTPERFLWSIRRRLINIVNEYGDGSAVPDCRCSGETVSLSTHFHLLERRSTRSEKKLFKGVTGVAEYKFGEIDDVGRWLLNVGFITGSGPDSSFGCGFLQNLTNRGANPSIQHS